MRPPLSNLPFLPVTAGLTAGILLYPAATTVLIPVAAALLLGTAVCLWLRRYVPASIAAAMLLGGLTVYLHTPPTLSTTLFDTPLVLSGTLTDARETEFGQRATLHVDSIGGTPAHFDIAITATFYLPALYDGARLNCTATLQPPYHTLDLPDEQDPMLAMRRRGIVATAFVDDAAVHSLTDAAGLRPAIQRMRSDVADAILTSPLDSDAAALLTALLTANDDSLAYGMRDRFSHTGTAHILALSGLHVTVIAWICFYVLLLPFLLLGFLIGSWRHQAIMTIVLIWCFVIFTGAPPSVVRAAVMISIFLPTPMFGRHYSAFNAMLIAAFFILLFSPEAIYGIGFWMSFTTVAVIVALGRVINPITRFHMGWSAVAGLLIAPLLAVPSSVLLGAYAFNGFSVVGIFSNIAIGVFLPFFLGLGIIYTILLTLGITLAPLTAILNALYAIIHAVVDAFASLPTAYVDNVYIPLSSVLMLALAFAVTILLVHHPKHRVLRIAAPVLLITAIGITLMPRPVAPHAMYITHRTTRDGIVLRYGTDMYILPLGTPAQNVTCLDRAQERYYTYAMRRRVERFALMPTHIDTPVFARHGARLTYDDRSYLMAQQLTPADTLRADYAVITYGEYRHPQSIPADTFLLAADIHHALRRRYIKDLTQARLPYKML